MTVVDNETTQSSFRVDDSARTEFGQQRRELFSRYRRRSSRTLASLRSGETPPGLRSAIGSGAGRRGTVARSTAGTLAVAASTDGAASAAAVGRSAGSALGALGNATNRQRHASRARSAFVIHALCGRTSLKVAWKARGRHGGPDTRSGPRWNQPDEREPSSGGLTD